MDQLLRLNVFYKYPTSSVTPLFCPLYFLALTAPTVSRLDNMSSYF